MSIFIALSLLLVALRRWASGLRYDTSMFVSTGARQRRQQQQQRRAAAAALLRRRARRRRIDTYVRTEVRPSTTRDEATQAAMTRQAMTWRTAKLLVAALAAIQCTSSGAKQRSFLRSAE